MQTLTLDRNAPPTVLLKLRSYGGNVFGKDCVSGIGGLDCSA